MTITRRRLCAFAAAAPLLAMTGPAAADRRFDLIDLAGRRVQLAARPQRIVLLEGHDLLTMSLLHPDPAASVVGWAATDRIDSKELQEKLENGRSIPIVGKQTPETISLEGVIALSPDLVVTNAFMTPQGDADPLIEQLTKVGIPVVFSDASSNTATEQSSSGPVNKLKANMRLWGALLGAGTKVDQLLSFQERTLLDIEARLSNVAPVTTYLEVQSTPDDCCWAAGQKVWGELLTLAGGRSLPEVTAPWFQKLSLEYLLTTPHDVYIATGGGWASGNRPAIGPGLEPELGREGLKRLIDGRPGFSELASVRSNRVHGIWSGLITNLPLNIVFVALAAKWLHPEQCADVDPAAILAAINRDFAAFPIDGPLWASI